MEEKQTTPTHNYSYMMVQQLTRKIVLFKNNGVLQLRTTIVLLLIALVSLCTADAVRVVRVNTGDGLLNLNGVIWREDDIGLNGVKSSTTADIDNTDHQVLYQSTMWSPNPNAPMQYKFMVDPTITDYKCRLHFAEIWSGAFGPGKRLFQVKVNGELRLGPNFDIWKEAGKELTAVVKELDCKPLEDGSITIEFEHASPMVDNPSVNAIEVVPADPDNFPLIPTITDLHPTNGISGSEVVITGSNIPSDATVMFDDMTAQSLILVSNSELRVEAPPHVSGSAKVTIQSSSAGVSNEHEFVYQAPPPSTDRQPGIAAYYYDYNTTFNGAILTQFPKNLKKPSYAFIESTPFDKPQNYDLFRNARWTNQFASKFNFYLNVPQTGNYVLSCPSNDGCIIYIDGALVLSNDFNHDMQPFSVVKSLTAGEHSVVLNFYQSEHRSGIDFSWKRPDGVSEVVPVSHMSYAPSELIPITYSILPASGPVGTLVTISGFGFTRSVAETQVLFGNIRASDVVVKGPSTIQARVPAGITGKVSVTVRTPVDTSGSVEFTIIATTLEEIEDPSASDDLIAPQKYDSRSLHSYLQAGGNPNPNLPVENALYRINCGQTGATYVENGQTKSGYKDKRGKVWANDQYYSAGTTVDTFFNLVFKEPHPYGIEATYDQQILLTERWSSGTFSYTFPNVPAGRYLVRCYWAELYNGNFELYDDKNPTKGLRGVGVRVFSVSANGQVKLPKIDVFQSVGPYAQMVREFWVDVTTQGQIKLDFNKIVESPMIQGIEIVAEANVVPQQVLPAGRKQGLASLFYNYADYFQSPIQTMPEGGNFKKPVSFVEISDYFSNPNNFGVFRSTPFREQFAMKSEAYLRVPVAGTYRITLESNDGSQMWIWRDTSKSGDPVFINNDGNHKNLQVRADITFPTPGFYPILLKYFQGHINTCVRIYWMTPSDKFSEYVPYVKVGRIIGPEFWSYSDDMLVPVATSTTPNGGPVAGGNTIKIVGVAIASQSKCRFFHPSFPDPGFRDSVTNTVSSDGRSMTCVVPPGMGGMGQVQVVSFNAMNQVVKKTNSLNYFFS